jgi:CDP-diacylglycerol--glycerol-3-phosphate 3-phosphatidyltransferase
MKIPNMLTILRFFLIPLTAVLLYTENPNYILFSIVFFVIAVMTDWADGYIARNFNQKSVFGTFFDPLVDKMLILALFFIFANLGVIPLWMALLILFRELAVTGIRQVCSTKKKVVGANWMGKSKFLLQTVGVIFLQIVIYLNLKGISNIIFNEMVAFYFILAVVVVSLAFAVNFFYWHRQKLLKGI